MGLVSLMASVAASQAVSTPLMQRGFLQFSQTAHLHVPASRYGEYAQAIARYLDGKSDRVQIKAVDEGQALLDAFSPRENQHLQDVRGIITALKWARWLGGGATLLILALLYLRNGNNRAWLAAAARGFAAAALFLLLIAAALTIWGAVNFRGLFWTFHQVIFPNDLWLLNPQTDLLISLMPLPFFTWYTGEMGKALLPILGVMLLILIAYWKTKGRT